MCPIYKVSISADGAVVFEGKRFVKKVGAARTAISQDQIRELIVAFEKINYKAWKMTNPDDMDPAVRRDDMMGDIYFSFGFSKQFGYLLTNEWGVQVTSNSYGSSDLDNDGMDGSSAEADFIHSGFGNATTPLFSTGNGGPGFGTVTVVGVSSWPPGR